MPPILTGSEAYDSIAAYPLKLVEPIGNYFGGQAQSACMIGYGLAQLGSDTRGAPLDEFLGVLLPARPALAAATNEDAYASLVESLETNILYSIQQAARKFLTQALRCVTSMTARSRTPIVFISAASTERRSEPTIPT